ncbi:MAG TPA: universal stress protein [Deltaproteobacteria bacterium]|jgi:nucleotide-binding universal stress UspA family protein|nr:universal stress protein [Deltaproteobacteria bacterium]
MLEKVLYPTDFSDVAMKAFQFVKQLNKCGVREVVILHVVDQRSVDALAIYTDRDFLGIEKAWEENVMEQIRPMEDELKELGFQVTVRIEKDVPFSSILKVEEEEDVSVIVIGSHGKSNVKEMLLGSVSEKVVRKARKPVLVVKR